MSGRPAPGTAGLAGERPRWRPWAATAARLLLATVWLVAGAVKLPAPAESVRAVRAYELLPETAAKLVGYGLPVLEVAIGVLLLVGLGTRIAAAVSVVLLVVFIAAIASAAARGLQIDCGCFGSGGPVEPGQTRYATELVRDAALLAVAAALTRWPASQLALDRLLARSHPVEPQGPHRHPGVHHDVAPPGEENP